MELAEATWNKEQVSLSPSLLGKLVIFAFSNMAG
jgi:hypothetical protein